MILGSLKGQVPLYSEVRRFVQTCTSLSVLPDGILFMLKISLMRVIMGQYEQDAIVASCTTHCGVL